MLDRSAFFTPALAGVGLMPAATDSREIAAYATPTEPAQVPVFFDLCDQRNI